MIHSHTALQQNDDVKRQEEGNRFFQHIFARSRILREKTKLQRRTESIKLKLPSYHPSNAMRFLLKRGETRKRALLREREKKKKKRRRVCVRVVSNSFSVIVADSA